MTMNNIVLVFNIRQSVFRHFGLSLFKHAQDQFGMHLLPIVTLLDEGIQQRALKLSKEVPILLNKINKNKAHFACYSTSGIDFRFAISELGLGRYVNTLTTISSPHLGSKLAFLSNQKCFKDQTIQPISRLTGVGLKPFHQFIPENMKNFNNVIKDSQDVQYYSVGSEKLPNQCSYTLSTVGKFLYMKTEARFPYHNDGVFGHDETAWGNYITNFEADHGQVIGMYSNTNYDALKTVKQISLNWNKNPKLLKKSSTKQIFHEKFMKI